MATTTQMPSGPLITDHLAEATALLKNSHVVAYDGTAATGANPNDLTLVLIHATLAVAQAAERQAEAMEAQTEVFREAWIEFPAAVQAHRPWWQFWGRR